MPTGGFDRHKIEPIGEVGGHLRGEERSGPVVAVENRAIAHPGGPGDATGSASITTNACAQG